ncbi:MULTISPECIES: hypothetical protein [Helicobacter]|uniref:Uncharacterized protein n=1 Tax=Helicobacter ganmani TaxID=60246 RepID=A0A3D8IGL9_9HELI|nr:MULTISPECIES: hypothetical protein [Helicobacter]RDU64263.1 hypothetical protein CQA43_00110 [Helicobacter ganmani]
MLLGLIEFLGLEILNPKVDSKTKNIDNKKDSNIPYKIETQDSLIEDCAQEHQIISFKKQESFNHQDIEITQTIEIIPLGNKQSLKRVVNKQEVVRARR